MKLKTLVLLAASSALVAQPALAQDSQSKRERENRERVERLEKQVRQMQKKVFPDGQPADTAGFYDEPVATRSSVDLLTGRIDALERQMATLIRNSEEAQYRLGQMEAEVARLRAAQEVAATRAALPPAETAPPPAELISRPKVETETAALPAPAPATTPAMESSDPDFEAAGEDAYDRGYQLWNSGKYDEAITVLRAMENAFPGHRRVSWARNLVGRSLLDKGQARAAAEALLANYRTDPQGERAADSLYFLGQALMKLGQAGQACKAYDELADVYAGKMRSYLVERLPGARAEAKCG
ncbi:tetratricopeptide repeat protein [Sphingomicrobium nitratireducens]|uniref:tetratricopeptide repeat protein n=1 Tax=Sphingomicrobium nitratireducens TaxID=2964666 RepID=UPI00223EBF1B|nr:hypothetical protein [Sphingomicrobium nitratireducens]